MKFIRYLFPTLFLLILSSCSSENILTNEERVIQDKTDSEVSTILFDNDLTKLASYRAHKNGFVVISFDKSIKEQEFTDVVTFCGLINLFSAFELNNKEKRFVLYDNTK